MLSGHFCHWKQKNTWFSGKGPMIPHGLHQHFHPILVLLPLSRSIVTLRCFFVMPCRQRFQDQVGYTQPEGEVSVVGLQFRLESGGQCHQIVMVLGSVYKSNVIVLCTYTNILATMSNWNWKGFRTSVETTNWEDVLERTLHLCLVCDASSHDLTSSFVISLFMKIGCLSQSLVSFFWNLEVAISVTWILLFLRPGTVATYPDQFEKVSFI